ncbi:uncharacterized protein LOC121054544 [Oryza brachyantha]|uniref:uncharacterized protein LOC121054544 n=1 Tax=Oryza brachyantha TaxID=4533 RepID=UPI001ADC611B|nr:uncharacterized protein LOC121054544 [Oryza brachyantha]
MGKRRGAAVAPASAAPVFPFPAAADADEPWHFSDYGSGDDSRLQCFFSHATRLKRQKPISKKQHQQKQQRRRWWSSAASAAILFFKRGSSSSFSFSATVYSTAAPPAPAGPLYLAVDEDDGGAAAAACACWAPAMRSGHLAVSELGASASVLPYVSLRDSAGGGAPAMPIYLVT